MRSEPKTRTPLAALALSLAMRKEAVRQNDPNLTIASQDLAEAAILSGREQKDRSAQS